MADTPHTSTEFEQQLALAHDRVLQMGARVERQVADAIDSLASGSQALIGQILRHEAMVNALEIEVDALVGQIIARRQPTARDLRMLMAVIKITTHLERAGDEAKKIALQAQRLFAEGRPMLPRYVEIRRISQMVLAMLRTSLAALESMEVGGAGGVADRDLAVDDAFRAVLRQLITYMIEDPRTITAALDILFIAKSLERIGDHAKNIAEQVIYAVEGRDVRHAADPPR
ncbi:MAG: phosphate signaling complex protein PhoU [Proteobacteria bacterium]|nr:phosphate signaling complex protein PhoU [Pseudomonadota bacterium]